MAAGSRSASLTRWHGLCACSEFYAGVNAVVVTAIDGAEHVYRFAKGLVVHYRIEGAEESVEEIDRVADDGLKITEGTIIKLDRRRQQIT